eukprot:1821455-Rhodomonas_salina.2
MQCVCVCGTELGRGELAGGLDRRHLPVPRQARQPPTPDPCPGGRDGVVSRLAGDVTRVVGDVTWRKMGDVSGCDLGGAGSREREPVRGAVVRGGAVLRGTQRAQLKSAQRHHRPDPRPDVASHPCVQCHVRCLTWCSGFDLRC